MAENTNQEIFYVEAAVFSPYASPGQGVAVVERYGDGKVLYKVIGKQFHSDAARAILWATDLDTSQMILVSRDPWDYNVGSRVFRQTA